MEELVSKETMKNEIRILIIGLIQFDRQALLDSCEGEGIAVAIESVESFARAAEYLSSSTVDLVITDFQVGQTPVFDRLPLLVDIPWIVLTAQGNENIAVQAMKSGAADYLVLDAEHSYLPLLAARIREIAHNQLHQGSLSESQNTDLAQSKRLLKEEIIQKERVQESLNESREIYRQFFQASSDAAFISSMDGRWIDMNQSALEMFGYQGREEIWNDSVIDVYWESEDQTRFSSLLKKKGSVQDHPVRFRRRDGKKIEALVSAAPYVIGGTVIGCQGFIRDITAEIRAGKVQAALDQLSLDLGASLSPERIYESVTKQIRRLFQPDAVRIYRTGVEGEISQAEFSWQTNNCPPELDLNAWSIPNLTEFVLESALSGEKVVCLPGLTDDPEQEEKNLYKKSRTGNPEVGKNGKMPRHGSTLIAPLVVEGQVIALIQLFDRDPERYRSEDLNLASRITNLVALGLQKAYLYQESQLLIKKLTSLQRIEEAVLENLSLPTTLDMLVDQLVKELGVDAADILYLHPKLQTLKFITQTGFRQNILQHTDLEIGEGLAGKAALSKDLVFVKDLQSTEIDSPRSLEFHTEGFHLYAGVPLLAKGRVVGVMELFNRSQLQTDRSWLDLLEMVAGLAAIAIDHQNLYNNLERSRMEISQSLDAILEGWAQALELRGIESPGHWRRIVDLTLRLAEKLGIKGDNLVDIRRGALLHDIGKMGIPDQILHKGAKLTDVERKVIGRHPVDAYELLRPVEGLKSTLDIPLYHHERWDGEGYPYQLAGEDIPYHARIFAVVDVWDALLSDRPYRKAFSREEALTHMRNQSGKHFDPAVVEAFLAILESEDTGKSGDENVSKVVQPESVSVTSHS